MFLEARLINEFLQRLGIDSLNSMQQAMLENFEKENSILLLSPTGTGKTLAYLLPLILLLDPSKMTPQCMILVPSRELAIQIEVVFKSLKSGFKVNALYGGHSFQVERKNLTEPPALIIGTPGRVVDHLQKGTFSASEINTLVFDEFDKILELGFKNEIERIQKRLSVKRIILTSATQAIELPTFVDSKSILEINYLKDQPGRFLLKIVECADTEKLQTLMDLLSTFESHAPTIIFSNHRAIAERLSEQLKLQGFENEYYHGQLDQELREQAIIKFRNGSISILVTTDLASRGLDIPSVKNVIHYQLPGSEDIFTHRNGRTARINASGNVYILLTHKEIRPPYISNDVETFPLSKRNGPFQLPEWKTIRFNKGKKDKINKTDILGFLIKSAHLQKSDVGIIEVKDFISYAAVNAGKVKQVCQIAKVQVKNKSAIIKVV